MTDDDLIAIYEQTEIIAVVGASNDRGKPAGNIPAYLQSQGFTIVPVNPTTDEVLGEPTFSSLRDVDRPIDVVDVFRPPAEAEQVARDAVAVGAKVLWFQLETHTAEAVRIAEEAGLTVVTDRCMGATHGRLGLGPGPD